MTTDELVAYYVGLLIIQYTQKIRARATVDLVVREAIGDQIIGQVRTAFDLATAEGAQLDVLGTYVGATRYQYGLDLTKTWFSMPLLTDPGVGTVPGFADVASSPVPQYFIRIPDFTEPQGTLTDGEFRTLIQYLIALENMAYNLEDIDLFLERFFGEYLLLTDNGNMSVTYTHDTADPEKLFDIVNNLGRFPTPAGVSETIIEV